MDKKENKLPKRIEYFRAFYDLIMALYFFVCFCWFLYNSFIFYYYHLYYTQFVMATVIFSFVALCIAYISDAKLSAKLVTLFAYLFIVFFCISYPTGELTNEGRDKMMQETHKLTNIFTEFVKANHPTNILNK